MSDFHIDLGFFFVILSFKCDGLLFVVFCGAVWFPVFLRCSFDSYWRSIIQSKIWASTLHRRHECSGHFNFILSYIFVDIMSLYTINLDVVSLFTDSFFTFLAVLNDLIPRFKW